MACDSGTVDLACDSATVNKDGYSETGFFDFDSALACDSETLACTLAFNSETLVGDSETLDVDSEMARILYVALEHAGQRCVLSTLDSRPA